MYRIKDIKLRHILNSNADKAVEADVILLDGSWGRASSPSAIIPGKLERVTTYASGIDGFYDKEQEIRSNLLNIDICQESLDGYLMSVIDIVGSDITLALSLAFSRAVAFSLNISFVQYLAKLLQNKLCMKISSILIPIFSGGIHSGERRDSFQQIMVCISENKYVKTFEIAKTINDAIEKELVEKQLNYKIGSSGGYVVEKLLTDEKLEILYQSITRLSCKQPIQIGVDIAAEHLYHNQEYHLDGNKFTSDKFMEIISRYISKYEIVYIEDPFVSDDIIYWNKFVEKYEGMKYIVGDDLFATQVKYIDPLIANGVVIKMNQVGTLTGAIDAIREAKENGMTICVSHRSYETEDTAMCDLAIASSADFIKIGGLTRGERIFKYNQLIRLEELLDGGSE